MPSRRDFLEVLPGLAAFGLVLPANLSRRRRPPAPAIGDSFPRQDPTVVEELVRVAHFDVTEVRRLVEHQPALARASWDWGFGDWETGLGAAAHTGKRDIAELLLAHGARPTIFSAAMMGHLDVVKALVAAIPGVQRTSGPHGLPLLAHARAGGADAVAVVRYLEALGDADRRPPSEPLDPTLRRDLVGRYAFGPGPRDYFDVDVRQDQLGLQRPGTNRRFLIHTGNAVFFPSGVPSVRVAFVIAEGAAARLSIADPDIVVTATRVAGP